MLDFNHLYAGGLSSSWSVQGGSGLTSGTRNILRLMISMSLDK